MEQSKTTIKGYFNTGDKPTETQYHDTWDSFWHKDEVIPKESVESQVLGFSTTIELNQSTPISALTDPSKIGIVSSSNLVSQIVFGSDLMGKISTFGNAATKGQLGIVISNSSNGQTYSGKVKFNTSGLSGNNTYAYFDVIENDMSSLGLVVDNEVQIVLYYTPQEPQVYASVLSAVEWNNPIPSSTIGDRFLVLTSGIADASWTLLGDIGDNEIYEVIGHENGAQFYAMPQSKSKLGQKVYVEDEAAFYIFKDTGAQNEWVKESSSNLSLEGYSETGKQGNGDLEVTLGDSTHPALQANISIDSPDEQVQINTLDSFIRLRQNSALFSSNDFAFRDRVTANTVSFTLSNLTNNRNLQFPDESGTLARIEDLTDTLPLSSTITTNSNALIGHIGGMNDVDATSNVTITIQDNATEDIPVGSILTYNQINDGRIVIAYSGLANGEAGQTYKKGDVLTLWHKSLDNWVILSQPRALDSTTTGEPTGSDQVFNIVSLTQAEYDAGTPVATTLYNITDA